MRGLSEGMTYSISVSLEFEYGHRLLGYEGACANMHGHHGVVEVEITGEKVDQKGLLIDFSEVNKVCKDWIDSQLDHSFVVDGHDKEIIDFLRAHNLKMYIMQDNPTAENVARLLFEVFSSVLRKKGAKLSRVRFYETPKQFAEYFEDSSSKV
jgi:6-pyruvoyltetrahydropterin/6-carboxytetrahydropterin synthase